MSLQQKLTMIITMLFGGFFGLLNETLLTTALPSIMADFHIAYSQVQWLTTASFVCLYNSALYDTTSVSSRNCCLFYWDDNWRI